MKPVTPTEKKILELVAAGFSTTAAAETLRISRHTVLSHRRNLLLKFNVRNSAQLIMEAMSQHVIMPLESSEKDTVTV